jgi:hypothetical protein
MTAEELSVRVLEIAGIDVGAMGQQQTNGFEVARSAHCVQGGPPSSVLTHTQC